VTCKDQPDEIAYLVACRQCRAEPYRFASAADRRDWVIDHFAATGHRLTDPLRAKTADGRWYGGHIAVEPPPEVTRVRSLDGRETMIRGAECEFCGPGHSHWAYVPAGAGGKPPSGDSTRQDEGGWHCWLDLDSTGALAEDTENDDRPRNC
jgi:hypothetical protein